MYRELGANGVVIGALAPEGDLDLDAMRRLMNCAGNMDVTLHRAFDMTRDPFAAMEDAKMCIRDRRWPISRRTTPTPPFRKATCARPGSASTACWSLA